MLRVTADVFSGRPNPEWIITDEQEARAALKEIAGARAVMAPQAPVEAGLGFRGVIVEPLSDELARDFDIPASAYLAATAGKGIEIAERLISLMGAAPTFAAAAGEEALTFEPDLQEFLRQQLRFRNRQSVTDVAGAAEPEVAAPPVEMAVCVYDTSPYNPGFWNNNATILRNNNCYNYASNKRTDTFAQPGRGCGQMYTAITCTEITRAALCDGLHRRYDCFPSSEAPRYLVAMVVAPGPGFRDYHWYRLMREGFWGHKPGSTPVRNVDNSNKVITNPAACDRGPYTQFCGYFYTCRSQKIK
jgi:hypothetical protein